jgi:hypothetical protein
MSDGRFFSEQFPRSSNYHPEWIMAGISGGANSLWLTEWLTEALDLRPGMRVLDLGCGRAASSIFLRREFGVQVWATDLWFSVSENIQRIRDAGAQNDRITERLGIRTTCVWKTPSDNAQKEQSIRREGGTDVLLCSNRVVFSDVLADDRYRTCLW